jgi:hypothetical protein
MWRATNAKAVLAASQSGITFDASTFGSATTDNCRARLDFERIGVRGHAARHERMGRLGSLAEGVAFDASPFDSMMVGREVIEVDLLGAYAQRQEVIAARRFDFEQVGVREPQT